MNKDEMKTIEENENEMIKRLQSALPDMETMRFNFDKIDLATYLYDTGCRKVGEDEIVVKKSELARLKNLETNYEQVYEDYRKLEQERKSCRIIADDDDDDEIVESMKTYERARQETAREIFQEILKDVESMECRVNLQRKTVKVEELKSYCDWIIHKVVPKTIKDLAEKLDIELEN